MIFNLALAVLGIAALVINHRRRFRSLDKFKQAYRSDWSVLLGDEIVAQGSQSYCVKVADYIQHTTGTRPTVYQDAATLNNGWGPLPVDAPF